MLTISPTEMHWCIGLLHGDHDKVHLVGANNIATYLDVQGVCARRIGDNRAAAAYFAASNHYLNGHVDRARSALQGHIDSLY